MYRALFDGISPFTTYVLLLLLLFSFTATPQRRIFWPVSERDRCLQRFRNIALKFISTMGPDNNRLSGSEFHWLIVPGGKGELVSFTSAGYLIKSMMFSLSAPPGWFCRICSGRINRNEIAYYFIQ